MSTKLNDDGLVGGSFVDYNTWAKVTSDERKKMKPTEPKKQVVRKQAAFQKPTETKD